MNYPTGEMPRCMGKKSQTGEWYWQPQHPECAGGPDPAFVNPVDGSNTRPKCPWFAQCAATTNANKLAANNPNPISMNMPGRQIQPAPAPLAAVARGVVQGIAQVAQQQAQQQQARPAAPLVPVQIPPPAPVQPWQQPQQQVAVRPPQWQQPQQQPQFLPQQFMQQQQLGQVPMVPPQMAMMPQLVPMNMPMPGAHIMGYLAVPEPIVEGQHWAARLGFSILRASFKATGHTMANFFDFNPFGSYPQNGG